MYELDLKVTIPNTVKFVNCCHHYQSHTLKMKVEGISYTETGLGFKFNLIFLRVTFWENHPELMNHGILTS